MTKYYPALASPTASLPIRCLQIVDNIDVLTEGDFVAHVVFRRPEDFLRSYYGQMVRMGANLTFDQLCSLVLLRRHHWLFRAMDYAAILRSKPCRDGRLRPVLFESLFHDGQLDTYMAETFDVSPREQRSSPVQANRSETDAVLDQAARQFPLNPTSWLELSVVQPSIQEHLWIDRLPEAAREQHKSLWIDERSESFRLAREDAQILLEARAAYGTETAKRVTSPIFQQLLDAIREVNLGIADEFPELPFAAHRYFD